MTLDPGQNFSKLCVVYPTPVAATHLVAMTRQAARGHSTPNQTTALRGCERSRGSEGSLTCRLPRFLR